MTSFPIASITLILVVLLPTFRLFQNRGKKMAEEIYSYGRDFKTLKLWSCYK